ncbi:MAG: DUF1800 domain-containing protein [Chloroflexi bacterium]|nr:DUF1800 domain-containing protein [Chloroflexota bacterium]
MAIKPSPALSEQVSNQRRQLLLGGAGLLGVSAAVAVLTRVVLTTQAETLPESAQMGHLLRRAGFGASPQDLAIFRPLGNQGAIDRLTNYESIPNPVVDKMEQLFAFNFANLHDLQRWWLLRMLFTTRPLEERMTLFWHELLTSAVAKVRPDSLYVQNQFFRKHALDTFPTILKGISRDPAMMVWLDLQTNRKGHANENFARELMELFSMGVGNYTEQDVRESARAFTGYALRYSRRPQPGVFDPPTFFFNVRQHDDGPKTFLGQTGNFIGDDIIDIIVATPASQHYICRRLFSFFAYSDPDPSVLSRLTRVYTASKYSIKAVVQAILTSPEFFSTKAYRATIKSPTEYIVSSLRSLGMITEGNILPNFMPAMGQMLFNPPNVAGWPGGMSWLNSGTWLARLNYANVIAASQVAWPSGFASVEAWLHSQVGDNVAGAVQLLSAHLLDSQIGAQQEAVLTAYASDSSRTTEERFRGLTYLMLALPEFHLS